MATPRIGVVGSINLDLVATGPRLPRPGETVTGATFARHPGGKGANQALAARRLGADVTLIAAVGADLHAETALGLLRAGGVDLTRVRTDPDAATGIALIAVDAAGENQIIVAPGANAALTPDQLGLMPFDAVVCQLETPMESVAAAAEAASGLFCLNAAPAAEVPESLLGKVDLLIVNDIEHEALGTGAEACGGLVAVTHGAAGATLYRGGRPISAATPPRVEAVDTVGAGDTFVAALTVALIEGKSGADALEWACVAAALATTRSGAQPSLPFRNEVDRVAGAG